MDRVAKVPHLSYCHTLIPRAPILHSPILHVVTPTDIDECTEGTHDCDVNALCMNTPGSFECMCLAGFTGDGRTCEGTYMCIPVLYSAILPFCHTAILPYCHTAIPTDIDECALDLDNCSPNANCTNTVGSFTCQCLPGFTGDGVECEGQGVPCSLA